MVIQTHARVLYWELHLMRAQPRSTRKQLRLARKVNSYSSRRIFSRRVDTRTFSFDDLLPSVRSSSIRRWFVPTFSFVRTMCERDRIARFSCTTLEILSVQQTDRTALDRRAFHYIRWYYLKRKTALFQILLCCVSQASTRDLFASALRETYYILCN